MSAALEDILLRLWSTQEDAGILTSEDVAGWGTGVLPGFLHQGLLVRAEPAEEVVCQLCIESHIVPVETVTDAQARFYGLCSTSGAFPVIPEQLQRWRTDGMLFGAVLRGLLGAKGTLKEEINGRMWHLGVCTLGGRPRQVYLVTARVSPAPELFEGVPEPLVFTPARTSLSKSGVPAIALMDVLGIDSSARVHVDKDLLSSLITAIERASGQSGVFQHNPDYTWVRCRHGEFNFSPLRGRIVGALYGARNANSPVLSSRQIQELLPDTVGSRDMSDLFKDDPAFGTLVRRRGKSGYYLDL